MIYLKIDGSNADFQHNWPGLVTEVEHPRLIRLVGKVTTYRWHSLNIKA